MNRIAFSGLLFVFVLYFVSIGSADTPDWEFVGLAGLEVNAISWISGGPCAITPDGFYLFDSFTGEWTPYVEPGIPGREISVVHGYFGPTGGVITGRIDEAGHGYLEYTYLNGEPNEIVYTSSAGEFSDIAVGGYFADFPLWAATRSGDHPGELLHSTDRGATWQLVAGHGMTSFTDLAIDVYQEYETGAGLYAAGDAGVVRTLDGSTWESFSEGLPPGPVSSLVWMDSAIPDLEDRTDLPLPAFFATTSYGLFMCDNSSSAWQLVLSEPCNVTCARAASSRAAEVVVLTETGRLFHNVVSTNLVWDWEDWSGALAVLSLVDIVFGSEIYVATANNGVYRTPSGLVDVPDLPSGLVLKASPDPFNAATTFRFYAPQSDYGTLRVYDIAGRLVADLLDEPLTAGHRNITWRPSSLPSGVYLLRLSVGEAVVTERVVLAK